MAGFVPVRTDRDYRPGLAVFIMKQLRALQHPAHQLIRERLLRRRRSWGRAALGLHEGLCLDA